MKLIHSQDLPSERDAVLSEKTPDQLRAEGETLLRHADALGKWARERFARALDRAVERAWSEPDDSVVKLQDGRQVARKFYDPLVHGPAAE
jgi:hypothetical protein